jgi:hypothetical protein
MQQQRTSTAVARVEQAVGSYRNPKVVTEWLTKAQEQGHLVSPATACGSLPEGCEVAITAVQVDIENETYDVGMGKRGLGGPVLDRISAGVGITADPVASGRLDNGSDPRYCRFKWVGHYRSFDGQIMTLTGEKEMDLREGSPQVEAIVERCVRKLGREAEGMDERTKRRLGREKAENQIREMRLHILAHAQTKARLRAIRSMGVRAAYPKEDLSKPFLMARVMFTGRTEDPVLKRTFGEMTAASFLGGTRALYGGGQAEPASRVIDVGGDRNGCGAPPPPVGAVPLDEDDYQPEPEPPRTAAGGNGGSRQPPPPQQQRQAGGIDTSRVYMPGKDKKMVSEASDKDLDYWGGRLARDLDDGKVQEQYLDRTEKQLAAIQQEIAQRRGAGSADLPLDGEPPLYPEQGAGPEGEY